MTAGRTTRDRKGKETGAAVLRRRVAELSARLEEAHHAYRVFLDDLGDGVVTLTQVGLILYANRRFAEIVGAPLDQVIGSAIFRFLSPAAGEEIRGLLSSTMAGPVRAEISLETTGGTVPGLLSVKAVPESEPPAYCMVVTDLSERKRGGDALRASHRMIEDIINAIPVRVFWKDRNLNYLAAT